MDWELDSLVDPSLEIIRTPALPVKPVKLVGDIGVRALPWHLSALRRLRRENKIDFVHITIPSFYSACLGQLLHRGAPLPFGLDYIDPWISVWPEAEIKYSKAWASMKLGERLEPIAVRNASLITGVASGYYAGVLERNPRLAATCVTAAMPYGFSAQDFSHPSVRSKQTFAYHLSDGNIHLVYAGALLPKGREVLRRLFEGVALLRRSGTPQSNRLRLHFIGTGKSLNDAHGYNVLPMATQIGIAEIVSEHPHRMGYLDVLAHLSKAFGILIVGSTERHYTPSKVFQAVQSQRPVFGLLHEASTAVDILTRSRAGTVVTVSETTLPEVRQVAEALEAFISDNSYSANAVAWREFDMFSARESARLMASALDEALELFGSRSLRAQIGSKAGVRVK